MARYTGPAVTEQELLQEMASELQAPLRSERIELTESDESVEFTLEASTSCWFTVGGAPHTAAVLEVASEAMDPHTGNWEPRSRVVSVHLGHGMRRLQP